MSKKRSFFTAPGTPIVCLRERGDTHKQSYFQLCKPHRMFFDDKVAYFCTVPIVDMMMMLTTKRALRPRVVRTDVMSPQRIIMTIMLMLMSMVRSTAAWSSASHFTSLESSTPDWNHQNDAGPTSIHAWWNKSTVSSSSTASESEDDHESAPSSFFIRPALPPDVGPASKILADGFFKDNTNFITYQFERLETWLSLDIGFPRPNTRHELFVACEQSTGKVLGLAEVDARIERPTVCNGPYLCNVAVDLDHLRQGIATALVEKCEAQVQEWVYESVQKEAATLNEKDSKDTSTATTSRLSSSLHLKVRQNNAKAVTMYDKLGYQSILQELDKKNQTVLVMRKQLERLNNNINNNNEEAEATKGVSTTR